MNNKIKQCNHHVFLVVDFPTSSLGGNDDWSSGCSGVVGCLSLRFMCNPFSGVVGVVFDEEETESNGSYDVSFSGF